MKYPKIVETLNRMLYLTGKQGISYQGIQEAAAANSDTIWNVRNILQTKLLVYMWCVMCMCIYVYVVHMRIHVYVQVIFVFVYLYVYIYIRRLLSKLTLRPCLIVYFITSILTKESGEFKLWSAISLILKTKRLTKSPSHSKIHSKMTPIVDVLGLLIFKL